MTTVCIKIVKYNRGKCKNNNEKQVTKSNIKS